MDLPCVEVMPKLVAYHLGNLPKNVETDISRHIAECEACEKASNEAQVGFGGCPLSD